MLLLVAALASAACDHDRRATTLRYLAAHEIARAVARFDGVALATTQDGGWAVWSDRSGTYAREIDRAGAPVAGARRLGNRCAGGLDAASAGAGLLVSCLDARDEGAPGQARLSWLHEDGTLATVALGPAGRDSAGIVMTESTHGRASVVWHDGSPGAWTIREAHAVVQAKDPVPRKTGTSALSPEGVASEQPTLAPSGSRQLIAWVELGIDPYGKPHGRVVATDGRHVMKPAVDVHWAYPMPVLARGPTGPVLAIRDSRRGDKRPHLYLRRLGPHLEPRGSPVRAGRADGPGAPRLIDCGGSFITVAPRTWGKDEYFVSIVRVPHDLRSAGREHEVSRYGRSYTRAAAACRQGKLLLLVAERGNSIHPTAALRSLLLDVPRVF